MFRCIKIGTELKNFCQNYTKNAMSTPVNDPRSLCLIKQMMITKRRLAFLKRQKEMYIKRANLRHSKNVKVY